MRERNPTDVRSVDVYKQSLDFKHLISSSAHAIFTITLS
jgi:hypothetical protein